MMPTRPDLNDHLNGVIANLVSQTGKPVGNHVAPDDGGWTSSVGDSGFVSYVVAYQHGAEFSGPLDDPEADVEVTYELVSLGKDEKQAQWMEQKSAEAMTKDNITVTGRRVTACRSVTRGTIQRDDSKPPLFYARSMFVVTTSPSGA